jgi:hypothetical protein
MSFTGSDIVSGAMRLIGRPAQADLPYQDVLDTARDAIRGRLVDLKLTNRNHTLLFSNYYTPTAQNDVAADLFGLSTDVTRFVPVKMEWRPKDSDSDTKPRTVTLVSYEQLSHYFRQARTEDEVFAAYYNGNQFAFADTTAVLANREYRIVYEDMEDVDMDALADTVSNIPDIFIPLVQHETALACLDLVRNETDSWEMRRERLFKSLSAKYAHWEDRFKTWSMSLMGNKKVRKLGYRPRR